MKRNFIGMCLTVAMLMIIVFAIPNVSADGIYRQKITDPVLTESDLTASGSPYVEITVNETKTIATAAAYGDDLSGQILIIAQYDKDGILASANIARASEYDKTKISVNINITTTQNIRAFLWIESDLTPVCRSVVYAPSIFLAGDQTMMSWASDYYPQQGWGEPFSEKFDPGVSVYNNAVAGYTAEDFYKNIWPAVKADIAADDYFIVGFLHNDFYKTCYSDSDPRYDANYFSTYKEYMTKFITECKAMGVNIVLIVPPNRGENVNFHINCETGQNFSAVIPALAKEYDVPCINIHEWTLGLLQSDLNGTKKKMYLYKLIEQGIITEDQLAKHPNTNLKINGDDLTDLSETGASEIADYVVEQIKTKVPELASYFK